MILVTLGTQDKPFTRLLEELDKAIIKNKIKEKVVVQAGYTKYDSNNMEIFDYIPTSIFNELVSKCNILITHGGVGSILAGIKANKIVISTPRLAKYKEHNNDHQVQIIKEFSQLGYIIELDDLSKIADVLKGVKKFKTKKFISNNKKIIEMIENYIDNN